MENKVAKLSETPIAVLTNEEGQVALCGPPGWCGEQPLRAHCLVTKERIDIAINGVSAGYADSDVASKLTSAKEVHAMTFDGLEFIQHGPIALNFQTL